MLTLQSLKAHSDKARKMHQGTSILMHKMWPFRELSILLRKQMRITQV